MEDFNAEEYSEYIEKVLLNLFGKAKEKGDSLAYVFALLGISGGMEDAGWQPIAETDSLVSDISSMINSPFNDYTRVRLGLFLYCHVSEANFIYHILYNLLLTIEGKTPKVFNFLDKYRGIFRLQQKLRLKRYQLKVRNCMLVLSVMFLMKFLMIS